MKPSFFVLCTSLPPALFGGQHFQRPRLIAQVVYGEPMDQFEDPFRILVPDGKFFCVFQIPC
jgi:hypothetical protein